jgi:hypothetical protein
MPQDYRGHWPVVTSSLTRPFAGLLVYWRYFNNFRLVNQAEGAFFLPVYETTT